MTSPKPTPTKQPDSPEEKAWANAIASEHATIYGYGFVSAHTTPDVNDLVTDSLTEHRSRRDAANSMLDSRSVIPPIAAIGYQLPITVKGEIDAATLAVRMESDDAVAWRAVAEQAKSAQDRAFAVIAVTECAVRAARWRQVLNTWPLTVPFPGGSE
jgi:Domain of unknown function (DUF4439)